MNEYEEIMNSAKYNIVTQIDRAYHQGYEDGKKASCDCADTMETEYNRGLNEAWEAAKKIARMDTETSENVTGYFGLFRIMDNLTAAEAIEKVKAYEQKQDVEIKVGDEVVLNGNASYENEKAIILAYDGKSYPYSVLMSNGDSDWIKEDAIKCKTGRHFDQIAEVLDEMRGDKE